MKKGRFQATVVLVVILALGSSFLLTIPSQASREIDAAAAPALDQSGSEMRDVVENYNTDRGSLIRTYPDALSPYDSPHARGNRQSWAQPSCLGFSTGGPFRKPE